MVKLTNKQKIEIYEQRLKGESLKSLSFNFNINIRNVKHLIRLIDKHGYNILRNGKNRYYSKEFKELTINRILINKESIYSIAIDIGLSSDGILHNWVKQYKENCYNVIEKKKGRKSKKYSMLIKRDMAIVELH